MSSLDKETIVLGLVFIVFLACIMYYYSNKNSGSVDNEEFNNLQLDDDYKHEDFTENGMNHLSEHAVPDSNHMNHITENMSGDKENENVVGQNMDNQFADYAELHQDQNNFKIKDNQLPNDCYPKDQLTPTDLLPQDPNSKWAQVNPSGQGDLADQNFLNAGYHIGINTVGQTLRNANMQLRSEPPNPQVKVAPWLQSTIEPDCNRRPMEIG